MKNLTSALILTVLLAPLAVLAWIALRWAIGMALAEVLAAFGIGLVIGSLLVAFIWIFSKTLCGLGRMIVGE